MMRNGETSCCIVYNNYAYDVNISSKDKEGRKEGRKETRDQGRNDVRKERRERKGR